MLLIITNPLPHLWLLVSAGAEYLLGCTWSLASPIITSSSSAPSTAIAGD
jgi:hypothetical protein